jgi:hypothetical protein
MKIPENQEEVEGNVTHQLLVYAGEVNAPPERIKNITKKSIKFIRL